jgi:hypothetical protein
VADSKDRRRTEPHRSEEATTVDDAFYTISDGAEQAVVRPAILIWIDKLRGIRECSEALHDILDVVARGLPLAIRKSNIAQGFCWRDSRSC